jgi:uncharacterized cofD-like protein
VPPGPTGSRWGRAAPLPALEGPRVVAFGGGHGLAVSLRALRRVTDQLTAVVGVADDGGSSGKLRTQFGVPPPGDLRMALAALCGDDTWGRTWSRVVQHRFGGNGDLRGHSLGNLLIAALWEETGDVVGGLDLVASLLGAQGRVLPVALAPLEIVAEVVLPGAAGTVQVRGQVAVATTQGRVASVRIEPANPPPCTEALVAVAEADHLVLGPGSWYTSVTAPLLVPELRRAVRESPAERSLVLNLCPQPGETSGFDPHTHLEVWRRDFPDIRLDHVFVDPATVPDPRRLAGAAAAAGAELVLRDLADGDPALGHHDPDLLAAAFASVKGRGRITPWP